MNRVFRSLMLSTFILSNVLTPLSYANLEEDLIEDDLLSKSGQKIIETQVINNSEQSINDNTKDGSDINSGTENTESTSKNINNNYEEVDTEDLVKPENDITISEEVTSNDGCYTFNTETQTITAYNCTETDIEIPSEIDGIDVKIIGQGVFYGKGIVSVKIPDTVEEIQKQAFRGTNQKKTLSNIEFGNNIKIIGEESFAVNPLSTVILPQSVTTISKNAFLRNSADPVIGILLGKNSVNSNASDSHLQIIRGYKVTYKDGNDIYKTSVTTGIVENLPGTKEGYELVGWYADSELSNSFDFTQTITADTTLYGKWDKIYTDGCYTFNESTQTITDYNATCSTEIIIPSSFDDVEVRIIGENAFNGKGIISVKIPDTVTTIQDRAFQGVGSNKTLNTVTLGNNVKSIGRYAFASSNLVSIILPDSLESTSNDTFFNNEGEGGKVLGIVTKDISEVPAGIRVGTYLVLERGYKVTYIDSGIALKTVITTGVVDGYLLDTKEGYLFDAWYKDENYTEKFDFSGTHANPITEDTNLYAKWDEVVRTDDGCYEFNKDKKTIIGFGGTGTCGTDIEIPSQIDGVTVEVIGGGELVKDGAFDYEGLTSVKIPDTIKEIQQNAFVNNQLAYISLGNSIEKIGRHAFQGNKLTTIYIPSSVTEIGNWAFSWNAVADIPCATHLSGYGFGVVGVYLSGDDTHLFGKDTCLQFQQGYSVKYMDGNTLYREDVSTGSVKNIELTGKDYYDFSGWYLDNTFSSKFDFSTIITGNTTLFAYWDPIIYHITYELNGGTNNPENPSTYTVESNNINLKAPTKAGYSFIGWTNIDIITPTMSITIKGGSTGDKSYTANWELNGYSGRGRMFSNNLDNEKETSFESDTKNNEDKNSKNEEKSDSNPNGNYDQELLDAYNRAVEQGLINSSFEDLFNEGELTRAEMAKIAVKYVQMLGMEKKLDEDVSYPDVNSSLGELENYIKSAYQYQIMGIHADGSKLTNFKPNKFVSRGEFATVFSRILHGFEYNINGANYYEKHLEVLKSEGILKDTNPARVEEKKWVILIMYRNQKNN